MAFSSTFRFPAAALLGAAAIVILAIPSAVTYVTGLPETSPLDPPDSLPSPAHETPMALLLERDTVVLTVREPIRLDRFIELNRLRRQRQQIRTALRLAPGVADERFVIPAGTTLRLRLTPEAPDIPGTTRPTGGVTR